jgi:hypothetical protein
MGLIAGHSQVFIHIGAPGIDIDLMRSHNQNQNLHCHWCTVLTELHAKWIPIPLPRAPTEVPLFLFKIICFHLMFN